MNLGLDIGYSDVKGCSGERRFSFPSVTGTPNLSRFSLNSSRDILLATEGRAGRTYLVGEGAMQSRFTSRREDRDWLDSEEYGLFIQAAFSELSTSTAPVELTVVSGLPISYYERDAERLKARLLGEHRITRLRRSPQTFRVNRCKIVPQGVGALLSLALDDKGGMGDKELVTGTAGIIDIGGKTTNFVAVNRLREQPAESGSIDIGAWDAVRQMREYLDGHYPGLTLKDHQVNEALQGRAIKYEGRRIDLAGVVDSILEPLAADIAARAGQLWNGGAGLDRLLVAGGGALLVGDYLRQHKNLRRLEVVDNPAFANAVGYWKYAQYITRNG